jgi:M6 family metalloprotease-like protein
MLDLAYTRIISSTIGAKQTNLEKSRKHMRISIVASFIALFLFTQIAAMPPHQRVLEMIKSGQIEKPVFMQDPEFFRDKGIDQGMPHRLAALDHPTGQFRALAILVKFSDHNSQVNGTYFDNLLYGSTGNTVKDYYSEVSYGTLDIITVNLPSSLGWRQVPQTYAYYVNGDYGFGSYPQNAQKLTEDAVAAVNPYVNFANYDNDGDGVVDALFIIHTGPGAEYTGSVNDIWSHAWVTINTPYVDGVYVQSYSMEPEYWTSANDMTCGVYCHELGHVFGLPDLYDTDYSSSGLGHWTVMAGGSWNGNSGDSPAHFDAWSRVFLGFANAINVTANLSSASFPAVEDTGVVYRLWTNGQSGTQYFLAENRQRTGYDSGLPWSGMCIYHVDESVSGNTNEWYPGHTSNGHYKVAIEQADGIWDLEHNNNSGDAGDPYPGSTNNRTFNNTSTPDSKNYSSGNTYVSISNISNSGATMTADLVVNNAPAAPTLILPTDGSATNNRRPVFDFSNSTGATVYQIQIDNNSDFSSPIYDISNLSSSQYTPTSNLSEITCFWHSRAGNGSSWSPWSPAWRVIIDATAPSAPVNLIANGANPSHWTSSSVFSINWTNPADTSGIQKALYKIGSAPSSANDTTGSFAIPPPRNITMTTQGGVQLYVWLVDNAGNKNYNITSQVALNYDVTQPSGCFAVSPDTSHTRSFRVSWSRGVDTGGAGLLGQYDLWLKIDSGSWNLIDDNIADTTVLYAGIHGHNYRFQALNIDNAGNVETMTSNWESTTHVDTTHYQPSYLPGDANNNGQVNGLDATYLVNYLKGAGPAPDPLLCGDANGTCDVNGIDVLFLVNFLKGIGPEPFAGNCR